MEHLSLDTLIKSLKEHNIRTLSRVITALESSRPQDHSWTTDIFERLLPIQNFSLRLSITGAPGVGKSTLIEALGLEFLKRGKTVAVLSIDPSSPISGGSIMADKTRMPHLSCAPGAYIRPSPSHAQGHSINPATHEVITLLEAVGFDVIIVETVGVGQSEIAVTHCTDMVIVLLHPGAGDDFQGIKRGLLELSDLVVINKTDGQFQDIATRTLVDYRSALSLMPSPHPFWERKIVSCSALAHIGTESIADTIKQFHEASRATLTAERERKTLDLFHDTLVDTFRDLIKTQYNPRIVELEHQISNKKITPRFACNYFFENIKNLKTN